MNPTHQTRRIPPGGFTCSVLTSGVSGLEAGHVCAFLRKAHPTPLAGVPCRPYPARPSWVSPVAGLILPSARPSGLCAVLPQCDPGPGSALASTWPFAIMVISFLAPTDSRVPTGIQMGSSPFQAAEPAPKKQRAVSLKVQSSKCRDFSASSPHSSATAFPLLL